MKIPKLLVSAVFTLAVNLILCASAQAEWFLRGTHNAWAASQMAVGGTNSMQLNNVVFAAAGNIKFDRFGDWKESYGVGGKGGTNIAVAAGTWNIKFFTDTKNWSITRATVSSSSKASVSVQSSSKASSAATALSISSSSKASAAVSSSKASLASSLASVKIHLRGTQNGWAEGDLFTSVAGSTTNMEICRNFLSSATVTQPRFRVDPNGGWGADAFPAADVAASGWTKVIINRSSKTVVSVSKGLTANCAAAASSSKASVASSSLKSSVKSSSSVKASSSLSSVGDDFRARTMYFLFVDRFANGNTSNDNGNNAKSTSLLKSAGDSVEWNKYWGGDIEGLIAKLDYLQALGVTAIWITPLTDNVDTGTKGAYHGYWGKDFYEVDEHLGNWALVDELDAQMEARGMKLVFDIALNHSNRDGDGTLLKEGGFLTDFASGKGSWYHDNGDVTDCDDLDPLTICLDEWNDMWKVRNKSLRGLSDFNHGFNANSRADDYLIGAALKWMDHGVDAFRIDAIKHLEPNFVNRFSAAVRAKKPDTYIFGEWYGAGANNSQSMTFLNERRGAELLDFSMRGNIESTIAGNQTMFRLNSYINSRPAAMSGKEDLQPIFLDNHDATRTSVYLQSTGNTNRGIGKGMSKTFADAREYVGMALVMTLPGVPVIYYGTEQDTSWFETNIDGLIGDNPYNREQMPSFSQTKPMFSMIGALAKLRKDSIAIQRGTYTMRYVTADILVFQRQEGSDCAVIAVNRGDKATISVPKLCLANGAYTNKIGPDIVSVSSGTASFTLSQNEVVVLRK